MEYKAGTRVKDLRGEEIGVLDRVVIDPRSQEVTDLVVRQGLVNTKYKVIPISLVKGEDDQGLRLGEISGGFDSLKDFEETSYVATDEGGLIQGNSDVPPPIPSVIYYPPMTMGPSMAFPPQPEAPLVGDVRGAGGPAFVEQTETNIPPGTVPLKTGAKVFGRDDRRLGNVDRVFTAEDGKRITHFLISSGWLFKEKKMVPYQWVDRVTDEEVHLAVGATQVERVPDYHET